MGLLEQIIDFQFNRSEGLGQGAWDGQVWIQGSKRGSEDRTVQAREEDSHFAAIRRNAVAMGMRNAPDDALETQTTQVVGQLVSRVR